MLRAAIFSKDRKYRYVLKRIWDDKIKSCLFICLNPSTANEIEDDPTIRRCIGYANSFGYGGMVMVNIFAYRSTNPKKLKKVNNPIGKENNKYIEEMCLKADKIILAWGNNGELNNRGDIVIKELQQRYKLYCFGMNKSGQPKHPLYLPKKTFLRKI